MGLKKGMTNNPNGRPKGTANKVTSQTREAFNKLIEDNIPNLSKWLMDVANEDPKAALDIIAKLAEYTTPKLARTETKLEADEEIQEFIVHIRQ